MHGAANISTTVIFMNHYETFKKSQVRMQSMTSQQVRLIFITHCSTLIPHELHELTGRCRPWNLFGGTGQWCEAGRWPCTRGHFWLSHGGSVAALESCRYIWCFLGFRFGPLVICTHPLRKYVLGSWGRVGLSHWQDCFNDVSPSENQSFNIIT